MILYADIMLILNLIVNYLILSSVALIIHNKPSFLKMILSALFGALCSFIILLPPLNVFLSIAVKCAISFSMTFIAFSYKRIKPLIKASLILFAVTFTYCGIMTAIFSIFSPPVLMVNNFAVYIDISPLFLIISASVCYLIVKFINFNMQRIKAKSNYYEIEITRFNHSVKCKALLDTGCNLKDLFSGNPVIVLEEKLALSLIPNHAPAQTCADHNANIEITAEGMRLIPYTAIGGKGMMQAFTPDKAVIKQGSKTHTAKDITIAIGKQGFYDDYSALIPLDIANCLE